ncbi:MAG: hypothetical protein BEN19_02065 [Epulopiscium sp. Nuni2H_MBin003]|nr:MAG: hypothetical protein BEN19_02065 [Epulopiscium sp. Nuni2H_MBin003]
MRNFKIITGVCILCGLTACTTLSQTQILADQIIESEPIIGEEISYFSSDYTFSNDYTKDLTDPIKIADAEQITITSSGTYEFSGNYNNIVVDVDKNVDKGTVYIVLNNVSIESTDSTPIHIIEAKDVVIVLPEGTENYIVQGNVETEDTEFPKAALYTRADTVITGLGSLNIMTDYVDGINGRDDLIIVDSTITVTAVEDGIIGKDLLAISNANITVDAGKDGIKSTNDTDEDRGHVIIASGTFNINAQSDAISAENSLQIDSGDFTLASGGGYDGVLNSITVGEGKGNTIHPTSLLETSMKAIKANYVIINGGTFEISAYEDAVHADGDLLINGGTFYIYTGDDAFHADLDVTINDIYAVVYDGYEGIEGNTININGGDIDITVLDDAINAQEYIKITDGKIRLKSVGDGIDSNGDLYIEGGEIIIDSSIRWIDVAVDVDNIMEITGGTIVDENGNELDPDTFDSRGHMNNRMPQQNKMPIRR